MWFDQDIDQVRWIAFALTRPLYSSDRIRFSLKARKFGDEDINDDIDFLLEKLEQDMVTLTYVSPRSSLLLCFMVSYYSLALLMCSYEKFVLRN